MVVELGITQSPATVWQPSEDDIALTFPELERSRYMTDKELSICALHSDASNDFTQHLRRRKALTGIVPQNWNHVLFE